MSWSWSTPNGGSSVAETKPLWQQVKDLETDNVRMRGMVEMLIASLGQQKTVKIDAIITALNRIVGK